MGETMRAIVRTEYGDPGVLRVARVNKPRPRAGEVLVRVVATTVNRTDCGFRAGRPAIVRLFSGVLRPIQLVLGNEFAGVVESVGPGVSGFLPGEEVFGLTGDVRFGAHAEFLRIPADGALLRKPGSITFAEAAALGDGVMQALAVLRAGEVGKGQRVLVNGATGSIGSSCVQLATHMGAVVTGVCRGEHLDLVRSLGAIEAIDYTKQDYTTLDARFDVVLDAVGKNTFAASRRVLEPDGVYVPTDLGPGAQNPLLVLATLASGGQRVCMPLPKESRADLEFGSDLVRSGKYRVLIDRTYSLEEIPEATRYVETETKVGNVVVIVDPDLAD
jgi:NADPH:quinone reductase-like Zn-dependent oxidoreductase